MRLFRALAIIAACAAAIPAAARVTELDSYASASACGNAGCGSNDSEMLSDPGNVLLASTFHSQLVDGSTANAHAVSGFGAAHVYADAFRAASVTLGDAQARGYARSVDFTVPSAVSTTQIFNLNVTGSHSPTETDSDASAYAYLQLLIQDFSIGGVTLLNYQWVSTDVAPTVNYSASVFIPANHLVGIELRFETDVATSNRGSGPDFMNGVYPVVSDYSHTAKLFVDPAAGNSALGFQSGHDYASPAVPEPATWALLIAGFVVTGTKLRRGRSVAT